MTTQRAVDLAAMVLDAAGTEHASVLVTVLRNASVRFGRNALTQNQDTTTSSVLLSVGDGRRKASVSFEDTGRESIVAAAEKARVLMEASPVDPEYMPPPGEGQVYPLIHDAADPEASECPLEKRMDAVRGVLSVAEKHGLEAGGFCSNVHGITAIATSTGNLACHEKTSLSLSFTLERGGASSFRQLQHESWSGIQWREASEEVAQEALSDIDQKEPEDGVYNLILEPQAVADLLPFIVYSMDARKADDGLTVFSGMQGKAVSGARFTLASDPDGPAKGVPFSSEGLPSSESVWIGEGVLRNLPCDRFWAGKTGREPLFIPESIQMEGGRGSTADLIEGTGNGILVRRLWYIRFVDQKTLKLTGMTRDGVFLIRNGRLAGPLKDFRWNWRPLELFARIEAMGSPERKSYAFVPAVSIGGVEFPCV